ncbi:stalk domain-containing protein [Paenibacillus sp. BK720]|uniref:stalk domain-containing protein n=1 Tax=Paenibacillus sp. BK720 TaxID=2587092 RepID=UPI00141DB7E2|nr:stalk domain-containing protein [Paenibacillus sp. BK720]NIK68951.1 PKD repeat protein [Paenibacillus sp. BK720]
MFKKVSLVVLAALLLFAIPVAAQGASSGQNQLILLQKTKQMYHNGKLYMAAQPLTELKGTTYISATAIAGRLGGSVLYDANKKEYVLRSATNELRYAVNKSSYTVNGTRATFTGAPFVQNGSLMIPLRSVLQPFGMTLSTIPAQKKIVLTWTTKPVAKFNIVGGVIYAGQTEVTYGDMSYSPSGAAIVNERWEGKQTVFEAAGTYTVTKWVQDVNGVWSDPYSVTFNVLPPNLPPEARFATDKSYYKMGELIQYNDISTDDENKITKREWVNNAKAFFEPGDQTVTLKVTDVHGLTSEFSQTITITNDSLYTKQEFDQLYTDQGEKFSIDGASVLKLPTQPYTVVSNGQQTFIRSNSPELINDEGIYYQDTANGNVRFLIHNQNNRPNPVKVYIVATNENSTAATVTDERIGLGGPAPYVTQAGKAATANYLLSRTVNPVGTVTTIPAGQSRVVLSPLSSKEVVNGRVITMYADVTTSAPIKFSVIVVDASKDVLQALPQLPILPRDGKHVRGTFEQANRSINVLQTIGDVPSRMILADKVVDTRLSGFDVLTGDAMSNDGNNGALYVLNLWHVKPHTLIALNPRGGHYGGAFLVNNKLVYATNTTILSNANEAGVLYRTGDTEESVSIVFTPASGSNLPINLLFLPLPEVKQ